MFKNIYKTSKNVCVTIACATLAYKTYEKFNAIEPVYATNHAKNIFPTSAEYPDLHAHRNIMSRHLTMQLYSKLRGRQTENGYTLDEAIQTGVDNLGQINTCGVVAGDEDSYNIFSELFDKIIEERHFGYKKDQKHSKNLNSNLLRDAELDSKYVLNFKIKTNRNIRGYTFPTFITRGERRDVETLLVKIFYNHTVDDEEQRFKYKGTYIPLNYISEMEEAALKLGGFWLERPYMPSEISATYARDWPDARGIWVNETRNISVFLNRKDHLLVSVIESTNDFKKVFEKFADFITELESKLKSVNFHFAYNSHLGYLTSSPASLGTSLKLSTHMRLPNLCKDSRLPAILKKLNLSLNFRLLDVNHRKVNVNEANENTIIEIASAIRLGKSEVQIAQMFVTSLNKLIEIEKKIENNQELDLFDL